jgi:hypothetical protein
MKDKIFHICVIFDSCDIRRVQFFKRNVSKYLISNFYHCYSTAVKIVPRNFDVPVSTKEDTALTRYIIYKTLCDGVLSQYHRLWSTS